MNQVNSLTSIPHESIVLMHQATMVANHLHKTCKRGTVAQEIKNLLFLKCVKILFLYFGK